MYIKTGSVSEAVPEAKRRGKLGAHLKESFMFIRFFSLLLCVVVFAGCAVKAQTYVMTKERVDIQEQGNAGYVAGSGSYHEPEKKTRKVYILELSKPLPEGQVRKVRRETAGSAQEGGKTESVLQESAASAPNGQSPNHGNIVIPPIEDEVTAPATPSKGVSPGEAVMYTVQKDDTLQKIAKRFYNSYGKWIKIYEANKDKIKNPNFVRPGTVLAVPQ